MPSKTLRFAGTSLSAGLNGEQAYVSLTLSGAWYRNLVRQISSKSGSRPDGDIVLPVPENDFPFEENKIPRDVNELRQLVESRTWYHTIDLGNGLKTPGFFDHNGYLDQYRLEDSYRGKRVLDVATFDGFWAFEFEKRQADEVVTLDLLEIRELDLAPAVTAGMTEEQLSWRFGSGFRLAREVLDSRVRQVHCNVYDLSPDRVGTFDIVHCGDLLLHITNPIKALQNICRVTGSHAIIAQPFFPDLDRFDLPVLCYERGTIDNTWWRFSRLAAEQMIKDAGFARVECLNTFRYGPSGKPFSMWQAVFRAWKQNG